MCSFTHLAHSYVFNDTLNLYKYNYQFVVDTQMQHQFSAWVFEYARFIFLVVGCRENKN